ncbi:4393_t:CDS:2 [Diversispora eburnea]|uniref:Altered inheritance of mitochondria protein 41 n=1 Tax=Diversispora eburnea TaxID=1213867 RepID=A0A9N8ZZC5_9GLOM|nr:4393_t:CDS:2 [Diversispora eburnea]
MRETETKISPLLIKLKTEVKDALRNKDQVKLNVVRGLLSDVTYASKSVPSSSSSPSSTSIQIGISDQDIYPIVNRAIKRHKESIDQFSKAGRMDLVEIEKLELDILNSYLPQPMTEQEIELEVIKVIKKMGLTKDDGGIKNMGKVMKELNLDIGRAPKNIVAQVVKNALSSNDSY